ncbi:hypothetical protein K8942_00290 [Candidatus Peribacteria bacterium]|nr:MAG: hypothetical protein K8942_00290 [Candidatus Peribacteria bacterium]
MAQLTFSLVGGSTLKCSGGPMPFTVFPDKVQSGVLNLLPSPQESPSREIISWPGEYDIAGITVRGIGQNEGQKVSYVLDIDDIRFAFPASPLEDWRDEDIERMGEVHVLVLPAEDPKKCQALLDEVDPRVLFIVPGSDGSLNPDMLKSCGAADKEHVKEFKLKGAFGAEGREVVVFSN